VATELAGIDVADYGRRDTVGDIEAAGHRLADLLLAAAESAPPGVVIDVIAHSQGGLVTRLAIADLAADHPDALDRLGIVATLGTPHEGADLAAVMQAATANPLAILPLDAVEAIADVPISPDDVAVQQLAPGSALMNELAQTPPPPGITFVSIAARGDVVVPSTRAHLGGATYVIVPVDGLNDHDALPGSAGATREIALAMAGLGPTCQSAGDAVFDAVSGRLVSNFENLVAVSQGG
jgi:hypothetical protein